jgi:uncharacterized protein YhfF
MSDLRLCEFRYPGPLLDLTLARDEGEGFADIAEWRAAHEGFWQGAVTDDTQIVVGRFRLVSASA